jgi:hypothetical protein
LDDVVLLSSGKDHGFFSSLILASAGRADGSIDLRLKIDQMSADPLIQPNKIAFAF